MAEHDSNHPETELVRLCRVLRQETNKLEQLARTMVDAESAHKVAYAQALLKSEGTVGEREARATIATDNLYLQRRIAEELYRVGREKVVSVRTAIEATRTLNSNLRSLAGVEPL